MISHVSYLIVVLYLVLISLPRLFLTYNVNSHPIDGSHGQDLIWIIGSRYRSQIIHNKSN